MGVGGLSSGSGILSDSELHERFWRFRSSMKLFCSLLDVTTKFLCSWLSKLSFRGLSATFLALDAVTKGHCSPSSDISAPVLSSPALSGDGVTIGSAAL